MVKEKKITIKTELGLNLKQEEFCKLYVGEDRDFFGNGTRCYLEVYGYKDDRNGRKISYDSAKANAYRLLTNDYIIQRVNQLLETNGFNEENVDRQHAFLINQFGDLKSKLGAIREYNLLKSRIKQGEGNKTLVVVISGETAQRYDIQPTRITEDNSIRQA